MPKKRAGIAEARNNKGHAGAMEEPSSVSVEVQTEGGATPPTTAVAIPVGALLTENQRAYCIERHKGASYSEAYARAFPGDRSKKENDNRGRKLARLPKVVDFLTALKDKTLDFMDIQPSQIVRETGRIAFSNIQQLFDATGEILPIEKWPEDAARAVASYKEEVSANGLRLKREIKLWDKPGMLKLLADIKALTNAKPDATQRATFTFNFGAKVMPRGKAGGRIIEHDTPAAKARA